MQFLKPMSNFTCIALCSTSKNYRYMLISLLLSKKTLTHWKNSATGRSRSLTLDKRNRARGMLEAGMSVTEAACRIGVHQRTISHLMSRLAATGSLRDRRRSGRPRITTPAEDRYIVLTSRRYRCMIAETIARQLQVATRTRASGQTIRRRLHTRTLWARKPCAAVPLTRRHRQARLNWTRIHRRWTQRQWNNVLFTDESRFNLEHSDGRQRVWRRPGERYDEQTLCNAIVTEVGA